MSEMPPAEAVIPLAAGTSNSAAEGALCRHWYEAHGSVVYNYFRVLVTAPDEAEELTAETFLRVVRHAARFDANKASARTWILRIARNVMRDQWRTDRRRKRAPVETLRDLEFDAPSPEERLIREEEVAQVLAGIARLPEADQELISLRYNGGLEHRDIAQLLGIRETAVRTRLWRALARLREAMA